MKPLLYAGLTATILLLGGCGGGDDAGACRFDVETMMSEGNYASAISRLEGDTTCQGAYPENEYNIYLGISYMGKAGLSVTDIISAAVSASDSNVSGDTFSAFIDEAADKSSSTALWDLEEAKTNFETYLDTAKCNDLNLSYAQKDTCMYLGLANVINATSTLKYLSEDITGWIEGNNTNEMDASACALEYAVNGTCSNGGAVTVDDSNITFDNNRSYEASNVTINGSDPYDYLLALPRAANVPYSSTVLTDGYCSVDFAPCTQGDADCHVCPVSRYDDELSTADILLETLNDGLDIAAGALSDDPELQADIEEFKAEVARDSGDITIDDIIYYLNN